MCCLSAGIGHDRTQGAACCCCQQRVPACRGAAHRTLRGRQAACRLPAVRGVQGAALWPGAVSPPGTPLRAFPAEPGQRRAAARRGREKERAGGRERPAMRGAPPAAGEGCACNEPRRAAAQSEPSAAEAPAPRRSPPCINKYRFEPCAGGNAGNGSYQRFPGNVGSCSVRLCGAVPAPGAADACSAAQVLE